MPFNNLSDAQAERLALLAEEAGEVVQAVGKILRHGYIVNYKGKNYTNRQSLEEEVGQLLLIVDLLLAAGDINAAELAAHGAVKQAELPRWTHYQDQDLYDAL